MKDTMKRKTLLFFMVLALLSGSAWAQTYTLTLNTIGGSYGSVTGNGSYDYNATVTPTASPAENGYFIKWSDGQTSATHTAITMTDNVTLTAIFVPKKIASETDWNNFADAVTGTGDYLTYNYDYSTTDKKNVSMTDNVGPVDAMVGKSTSDNKYRFKGVFDGQGNTLTFNKTITSSAEADQYTAPFRFIDGATIQNLNVTGEVSSSNKFAGGVVAHARNNGNIITNCVNSTIINASKVGNNTAASHGGILGQLGGTGGVTISGCVFNGQMIGTEVNYWCGILGFISQKASTVTIKDCLFAPTLVDVKESNENYSITREWSGYSVTASNNYYNVEGAKMHVHGHGTLANALTLAANPTEGGSVDGGTPTTNYGFVKAYSNGLLYNGIYYANGSVNLTATSTSGYTFLYWNDGNTQNPRSLNVTENASYTAVFSTVQTIPFTDDFESDKHWAFVNGDLTNQWCIGTAEGGNNGGSNGLYISNDGGSTYAYNNDSEAMVYAYQLFHFEAGNYSISYDWKCSGDNGWDFLRVALVPLSYELVAGTSLPNGLTSNGGVPEGWIEADGHTQLNLMNTWTEQERHAVTITIENSGYYRLTFCWRNDGAGGYNPPAAIDNVGVRVLKTFTNATDDDQWSTDGNWTPSDAPTFDNDVLIAVSCTIGANDVATANAITIADGKRLNIEDGGQLRHNSGNVTNVNMEKSISGYTGDKDNYYFIASPDINSAAASNYTNLINSDPTTFVFYTFKYDNVENSQLLEWKRENGSTNITRKVGYLYANSESKTITMPNITVAPSKDTCHVYLRYTENGTELFNGWNLIGNPFACNASVSGVNFYVIDGEDVKAAETNVVAPMQGIFAKATTTGQKAIFSRANESNVNNSSVNLILKPADTRDAKVIDVARVRFNEGEGLEKFQLNPNHTKLYIPQDGTDYAVVHTQAEGELPVNLKVENNGRYTLSADLIDVEMDYLHLIDNMTGADVDLLAGASTGSATYTFNARTTDYASRFKLVFSATGVEENGASTGSATFAYYNGSEWNISNAGNATLQVVDMTGRVLSSEQINGNCTKAINAAQGIYMLRLINGDNVKVQKVVVK